MTNDTHNHKQHNHCIVGKCRNTENVQTAHQINASESEHRHQMMDRQWGEINMLYEAVLQIPENLIKIEMPHEAQAFAFNTPVAKHLQFTPGSISQEGADDSTARRLSIAAAAAATMIGGPSSWLHLPVLAALGQRSPLGLGSGLELGISGARPCELSRKVPAFHVLPDLVFEKRLGRTIATLRCWPGFRHSPGNCVPGGRGVLPSGGASVVVVVCL